MHTQGTWKLGNAHGCGKNYAVCVDHQVIARVVGFGYPAGEGHAPESDANARLIAAAPDLLAALQAALPILDSDEVRDAWVGPQSFDDAVEQVIAAIAKATGGQS